MEKGENLNYEMLLAEENCNSFVCKCPSCEVCRNKTGRSGKNVIDRSSEMRNCTENDQTKEKKSCCGGVFAFAEECCPPGKKSCCFEDQEKEEECCQNPEKKPCPNNENCCKKIENQIKKNYKAKSSCFCRETKEYHHVHGSFCEHLRIVHNGHVDFIVDGHLHFPHEGHCDDHGRIEVFYELV